ncbi:MAG: HAMP domain-containing histidine kinase [Actinomycetota bacterium]|nr:HAMP domain-containing histidine kinase [Actinomycetota bacterium]
MTFDDGLQLVLMAAGAALVSGLFGGLVLLGLRGRSIRVQVVVVGLTSVLATAVGVMAAASAMFISQHDLQALLVVLLSAGVVGAGSALVLGNRIAGATRSLSTLALRLGEEPASSLNDRLASAADPIELQRLRIDLEATSRRLDEARRSERALESSRRELVAWVSHDLRTPLAGIRALVEALEDEVVADAETVARYHRTIREEADRLSGLVDDLFELSRIHAGALQLRPEEVLLGDLVSDALAGAAPVAAAKGVRLVGRVDGDDPRLRLSTPEVLRVLRNLLDNAIRHTPSDGSVVVQAGTDDGAAYVEVADSCGGIPDEDLDRVFDLAFRGDTARSPASDGGGGLGLAIARGLVEAHDGAIAVRNDGDGCRFTIRLPLSQ